MIFLFKGLILGLAVAAPIGPIGMLCIRRTLTNGRRSGIISGLGTATADMFYGCVAAFGVNTILNFLLHIHTYLQIAGGIYLIYLGYQIFISLPAEKSSEARSTNRLEDYISALVLTLTNPMTIVSFSAIFMGLGIGNTTEKYVSASFLVIGIFLGSILWWLILSSLVNKLKSRFDQRKLNWVNKVSGIIICVFGIYSIISQINNLY